MSFLDHLDRRFGRFSLTHVTLYLIIGQVFVTLTAMLQLVDADRLTLIPALILNGEPWRAVTFLFVPPPVRSMFGLMMLPFGWWIFFLMGNALEHYWGAFRYNVFLFFGFAATVGFAFFTPQYLGTNWYFYGSVFLAFAWLNPDFELSLFFILPLKVKWLALFTAVGYAYKMVVGSTPTRWAILASVGNFLLFFGREIIDTMRYRRRTMVVESKRRAEEKAGPEARHRCHICGKTDLTNPEMDFRYCSKCAGDQCYCPEHIFNHEHVLTDGEEVKS